MVVRPRDIYTDKTREEIMRFLAELHIKVIGFRPPTLIERYIPISPWCCKSIFMQYTTGPLDDKHPKGLQERLIVRKI
jgi:hypothetical protein